MTTQVSSTSTVSSKLSFSVLAQNISAVIFGAVVLFAVGFMPMDAAHNVAHDTRHTLAFPCH